MIQEFITYLNQNTDYHWVIHNYNVLSRFYQIKTIDKAGHERHFQVGEELLFLKDKYELLSNHFTEKLNSFEIIEQLRRKK